MNVKVRNEIKKMNQIYLKERTALIFKTIEETHKITINGKKVNDEIVSAKTTVEKEFPFREVEKTEILSLHESGIPGFILKENGKYYYTEIEYTTKFYSTKLLGDHVCAEKGKECRHLSAAGDENGGCSKIREGSSHIENYDYITLGYETFNTCNCDAFVVLKCNRYEKCLPKPKISKKRKDELRVSVAQFLYDDVESLADIRRIKERNSMRYSK